MANVTATNEKFGISATGDASISYPPNTALALIEGSGSVLHPQPLGMGGDSLRLRIVGRPFVIVRRNNISEAGYEWYWNFIVSSIPTAVYIQAYEIRNKAWNVYSATMDLPTISNIGLPDLTPRLAIFETRFTNLIKQTKV